MTTTSIFRSQKKKEKKPQVAASDDLGDVIRLFNEQRETAERNNASGNSKSYQEQQQKAENDLVGLLLRIKPDKYQSLLSKTPEGKRKVWLLCADTAPGSREEKIKVLNELLVDFHLNVRNTRDPTKFWEPSTTTSWNRRLFAHLQENHGITCSIKDFSFRGGLEGVLTNLFAERAQKVENYGIGKMKGKLVKTATAQGLLIPPTSTTIVQPANQHNIQEKVAITVGPQYKNRAQIKRLKIADPAVTVIPTIVPPNHSSTTANQSTSSLPTNIILPNVTNNTTQPIIIPPMKPPYNPSSVPFDHHQAREQINVYRKRIDDLEATVYSELHTIETNCQSFKENMKLLFKRARDSIYPYTPVESSPQDIPILNIIGNGKDPSNESTEDDERSERGQSN